VNKFLRWTDHQTRLAFFATMGNNGLHPKRAKQVQTQSLIDKKRSSEYNLTASFIRSQTY
jgi:hypothetical protein